jgi:iron complex outermembrane receptor protein
LTTDFPNAARRLASLLHTLSGYRQPKVHSHVSSFRWQPNISKVSGGRVMKQFRWKERNAAQRWLIGSTLAAMTVPALHAQESTQQGAVEEVIVTGTRRVGVEAADSAAPVQVLDSATLSKVAQPDLVQALAQNVPSFSAQAFGGDTAALTLSAKLRGLSPNHALVLINGKRRHTTANLAVLSGPYQGGASTDLNFIPVGAIQRVEVLQDGAAAQYGSDAIAGVINIILQGADTPSTVTLNGGGYFRGDGDTSDVSGAMGFQPTATSFISIAAEARSHDRSERGGIDPRVIDPDNLARMPSLLQAKDYPRVNLIQGDADYDLYIGSINAGAQLSDNLELYAMGTYGNKHGRAYENYRLPNRLPGLYPFGFSPQEESREDDYGITLGLRGSAFGLWNWDLGTSFGSDAVQINTIKSGNVSLFNETGFTPTRFRAGNFKAMQWSSTLDVSREIELGMPKPLNVAFGVEYRREEYDIRAGDGPSRFKEGAQSFPGFALTDAGEHTRNNKAVYVDVALFPLEKLQLDLAGRYEDFSDFGNTTVGKLTARYDFTDSFALRGTLSTGFRAPTLAEEFYSATNVSPTAAFVQLPPNSPAAKLVGVNGLDAEESTNFSLGFVAQLAFGLTATVDAYQIRIDDRVVGSGSLFGAGGANNSAAVSAAIAANGNVLDPTVTQIGINIFSNGLDTRTRGAELVLAYSDDYSFGHIDWTLSANYNDTEVTRIKASPVQLAPQGLFDRTAISELETAFPKYRAVLGASWSLQKFSAMLRETLYGRASDLESPDGGIFFRNSIGVTPITDVELAYQITDALKITLGANNLFDEFPDKKNSDLLAAYRAALDNTAVAIYPAFSSFGINGGYYFGKLSMKF